jgi:hypothetical protein
MGFRLGDISEELRRRSRPCWRKQRWPSLGAAQAQLRSLLRSEHVRDTELLNAYLCPHCEGYHIGRHSR